jgi:PAS domain S-box-containing protein
MINTSDFPLLDRIPTGIIAVDTDAMIVLWNKQIEQWSGCSRDRHIGKNLYQQFPKLEADEIKTAINQVLSGGAEVVFPAKRHHHLIPCPMPNGQLRTHSVTVTWLDQFKLALFCIQDQTEEFKLVQDFKQAAEELQSQLDQKIALEKKNLQLISAIDQAGEAIIITDDQGNIEYVNHAFGDQTGWGISEINCIGMYDRLFADGQKNFKQHLDDAFKAGEPWQGRRSILRKDRETFTASITIAPIFDKDRRITHTVIIQEDISRDLAIEEKVRNAQKQEALITLVGGIAHDFNNMLAGLLGQAYLATREVKDMPKTVERMKIIQNIATEAAEIVKQLLTFARQGEHLSREFPLGSFIKQFYKLAEHSVPESINFSLDFNLGKFAFTGDANQLQQALLNIIHNAVEACKKKQDARIELGLSQFDVANNPRLVARHPVLRHGNFAHIYIRDNGDGISNEHIEKIFDPFFTTKELGSGLGLAMVLGCIRNHHGMIDVESSAGQGTTFHFFLPIKNPQQAIHESIKSGTELKASILLVDDDPRVLEPTKELLESMGHLVTLAEDGQQACEIFQLQASIWDIVITDVVMPRMNGFEAVQKMRLLRPDVPVIFATGYDQSLVEEHLHKLENSILISKPFSPNELDQLIISMVRKT